MIAPDSHRTRPVFGSSMAGFRPLGLMSVNGFFLTSSNLKELIVYGTDNSSRITITFQGFGPGAVDV
jgi:hypothetical protein